MPVAIGAVVVGLVALLLVMRQRADEQVNKVALTSRPKPATVVKAKDSSFQSTRTYVGSLEPWVESRVGPQFVSAYISTVLVRPGAVVKKGAVLATLDCRNANALSQSIDMEARALDAEQKALADESARVNHMLDGGYVSETEAETKTAQSASKQAEVLSAKAKLLNTTLAVDDCVLRAPFDGEIGNRWLDPGAFVHPGDAIVSVVDRSTVRYVTDIPEDDFDVVPPGKEGDLVIYAMKNTLPAHVSRRAPSADRTTRTVHIEADLPNPDRRIPVFTTGEFIVGVGKPIPAIELPLIAANIKGSKATVFVVKDSVAKATPVRYLGELGGSVFVDTSLPVGAQVVTEGRSLLANGDHVEATVDLEPTSTASAGDAGRSTLTAAAKP